MPSLLSVSWRGPGRSPRSNSKQSPQLGPCVVKRSRAGPTLALAWLLGAVMLSPAFTLLAIGQEVQPETSVDDGQSEDDQPPKDEPAEVDESTSGVDDSAPRRRFLKRLGPQPVTPEQREEAERIRKLAAKYGTDPTAIVSRMQLSSQHADLVRGAQATDTVGSSRPRAQREFFAPCRYAVPPNARSRLSRRIQSPRTGRPFRPHWLAGL